jgi:hypothetical protein
LVAAFEVFNLVFSRLNTVTRKLSVSLLRFRAPLQWTRIASTASSNKQTLASNNVVIQPRNQSPPRLVPSPQPPVMAT